MIKQKTSILVLDMKALAFTPEKRLFIKAWPCLSKSYSKQFQTFILMLTDQLIMGVPSALWSLSIYWFSCHGICVQSCWIYLHCKAMMCVWCKMCISLLSVEPGQALNQNYPKSSTQCEWRNLKWPIHVKLRGQKSCIELAPLFVRKEKV